MTIAIISDTHMPRGGRELPETCVARLRESDAIVHAGDLCTLRVLEWLRSIGPPVHAVHGNVDDAATRAALPEATTLRLGDRTLAVLHDAGPARGRVARMRRRFPDADVVVFGHSHIPLIECSADGSFAIVNPGSPTERRRAAHHTMALARRDRDGALALEILDLD